MAHNDTYPASVSRVLFGDATEYVVTHPGLSQYSQPGGGVSACGIAAMNCARVVLELHAAGLDSAQLVQELMKRSLLEDVLSLCSAWPNSAHLSVEEIHKAPMFRDSLFQVYSDQGPANFDYFRKLISATAKYSKKYGISDCLIITRPPEIIACFCLANVPSDLFVTFDSHPRHELHPEGAAFIFKNSVQSTAEYIAKLFHYEPNIVSGNGLQWQAQLLGYVSGNIFIARNRVRTSTRPAETRAAAASTQQARGRDLQSENQALQARLIEEGLNIQAATKRVDELLALIRGLQTRVDELESQKENFRAENVRLYERLSSVGSNVRQLEAKLRLKDTQQRPQQSEQVQPSPWGYPPPYPPPQVQQPQVQGNPKPPSNVRQLFTYATQATARAPVTPSVQNSSTPAPQPSGLQRNTVDADLALLTRNLSVTDPAFFGCGTCRTRLGEIDIVRVMPCGHSYCKPCLRSWVQRRLAFLTYPIPCPTCTKVVADRSGPGVLDHWVIKQLGLPERDVEIFTQLQLAPLSTTMKCHRCLTTIAVDRADYEKSQVIECPLPSCRYRSCKWCSRAVTWGQSHLCFGNPLRQADRPLADPDYDPQARQTAPSSQPQRR